MKSLEIETIIIISHSRLETASGGNLMMASRLNSTSRLASKTRWGPSGTTLLFSSGSRNSLVRSGEGVRVPREKWIVLILWQLAQTNRTRHLCAILIRPRFYLVLASYPKQRLGLALLGKTIWTRSGYIPIAKVYELPRRRQWL